MPFVWGTDQGAYDGQHYKKHTVDTELEFESLMSQSSGRGVHCPWDFVNLELGILHSLQEGSSDAFDVPVRWIGRICEEVV